MSCESYSKSKCMNASKSSKAAPSSGPVDVYVKLASGRTTSLRLQSSDTVRTICDQVAKEEGVSTDRVQLKYTGKVLDLSHTIGYLGVCAETILKAEIIEVRQLSLFVRLDNGKTLSTQLSNISSIRAIKDFIRDEESIDISRQVLKLSKRVLNDDSQRLIDAGITNECVLDLCIKEPVTSSSEVAATDEVQLSDEDKDAVLNTFRAAGKPVEVVFSFDTTGSMYSCLSEVRSKLRDTVTRLLQQVPLIRIGIIAHGDYCDYGSYVLRMADLTTDVDELVKFVQDVPSTGGGDGPECYEWVLRKAQQMDWSEHSAKALVVIGDCEPHEPSYTDQRVKWRDELDVLKAIGVKVYGVRALSYDTSQPFYEYLAEHTGGAYISFSNFNIITEMFLAVCYREASAEQYEQYCEEVTSETATSDAHKNDVKDMLKQLDEQKDSSKREKPKRYVNAAWWDLDMDNGSPGYTYDTEKDTWKPITQSQYNFTATTHATAAHAVTVGTPSRMSSLRRKFSIKKRHSTLSTNTSTSEKKRCAIM